MLKRTALSRKTPLRPGRIRPGKSLAPIGKRAKRNAAGDAKARQQCKATGVCLFCGTIGRVDWAHIIGRNTEPCLRDEPLNSVALCRKDHRYFTDHPAEFEFFLAMKLPGRRAELLEIARATGKARRWET